MGFEIKKYAQVPSAKRPEFIGSGLKKCPKCEQAKALECFSKNKIRKDGLDCWCKDCINAKSRVHHAANREEYAAHSKKWAQENPERMALLAKNWRAKNLDRANENRIRWRKENPERTRFLDAKRYAQEFQATPSWADSELMELVYAEATHRGLIVDHIVPLQGKNVCGLHVHYNTQLLTRSENSTKNNRWPYPSKVSL
jgi:hypothetical protein